MSAASEVPGGCGTVLRSLRELAELTIDEAAALIHARATYLREVESGMTWPSNQWIAHVAGVYASALIAQSHYSRLRRPGDVDERLRALDDVQ